MYKGLLFAVGGKDSHGVLAFHGVLGFLLSVGILFSSAFFFKRCGQKKGPESETKKR